MKISHNVQALVAHYEIERELYPWQIHPYYESDIIKVCSNIENNI